MHQEEMAQKESQDCLVNRENLDFLVLLDSGETREFLEEMDRRVSQE